MSKKEQQSTILIDARSYTQNSIPNTLFSKYKKKIKPKTGKNKFLNKNYQKVRRFYYA